MANVSTRLAVTSVPVTRDTNLLRTDWIVLVRIEHKNESFHFKYVLFVKVEFQQYT